jgi:hypothetical protein
MIRQVLLAIIFIGKFLFNFLSTTATEARQTQVTISMFISYLQGVRKYSLNYRLYVESRNDMYISGTHSIPSYNVSEHRVAVGITFHFQLFTVLHAKILGF